MSPQAAPSARFRPTRTVVDGLIAAAAADEEGHLALGDVVLDDGPGADMAAFAVVGLDEAFDEFVGTLEGVVDELFHRMGREPGPCSLRQRG